MNKEIKNFFDNSSKYLDKQKLDSYDIYLATDKSRQLACREFQIEDYKESVELGYSIRVMKDSKISFVYGNELAPSVLDKKLEEVVLLNRLSPKDETLRMPKVVSDKIQGFTVDDAYDRVEVKDKEESLKYLEKKIREKDKRITNVEHIGFSESSSEIFYKIQNSDIKKQKVVFFGYEGEVIAEENGQMESGGDFSYKTNFAKLQLDPLAEKVANNVLSMLGAKPMASGECKVVFRNDVAALFLSTFASLFSADQVQNNKSVLKDKLGSKLANAKFSLFDDGSIEDTIGYSLVDGEGVGGQRTQLIDNGKLCGYLYDLKSAAKDGVASTGNAIRGGYDSMPSIKPTNLIVPFGQNTLAELLDQDKVLFVTNVMGMHTVNSINGEFSVGASGVLFEKGKPIQSVRQITIAGDFLTLLASVSELGNDADDFPYNGNIITPSWFIEKLMISGL